MQWVSSLSKVKNTEHRRGQEEQLLNVFPIVSSGIDSAGIRNSSRTCQSFRFATIQLFPQGTSDKPGCYPISSSNRGTNSNCSPLKSPWSLSFNLGITSSAIKESVINGACKSHPMFPANDRIFSYARATFS